MSLKVWRERVKEGFWLRRRAACEENVSILEAYIHILHNAYHNNNYHIELQKPPWIESTGTTK